MMSLFQLRGSNEEMKVETRRSLAQTSTERSRKFRAQKKALEKYIRQNSILYKCPSDDSNLDENSSLLPENSLKCSTRRQYKSRNNGIKKSAAQRSREYRLRKKALERCDAAQDQTDTDFSFTTDSFNDDMCFVKNELDITDAILDTPQSLTSNHHLNDQINEHDSCLSYNNDNRHSKVKKEFNDGDDDNSFGHVCCLCDKSWFNKEDFKCLSEHQNILNTILPNQSNENIAVCNTCMAPLNEDKLPMMSNIILLSELCSNDYDDVSTPKFKCVIKHKQPSDQPGVSMTHSQYDTVNIITSNIEMTVTQSQSYTSTCHPFGEICIAKCVMTGGKLIVIAAIYITPNIKIDDMIYFIQRSLLVYSHEGAAILGKGGDKVPLILGGNFNMNFASEDSTQLVNFLRNKFSLFMNNELTTTATKPGTVDTLFSRHLNNIESQIHISHLNYQKPLVSASSIELMPIKSIKLEEIN